MTREEAEKHLHNDWYEESGKLCVDADKKDAFLEAAGVAITALRSKPKITRITWRKCWKCDYFAHNGYGYCAQCGRPIGKESWDAFARRVYGE